MVFKVNWSATKYYENTNTHTQTEYLSWQICLIGNNNADSISKTDHSICYIGETIHL